LQILLKVSMLELPGIVGYIGLPDPRGYYEETA